MRYISTRDTSQNAKNGSEGAGFREALLGGLAPDGGLYVPQSWPQIEESAIYSPDSYPWLAAQIIHPYIGDFMDKAELLKLLEDTYQKFNHEKVVPLRYVEELDFYLLELFHGPTLAFKDVALQLVGGLFEEALKSEGRQATILTATSGDTGAAAISACLGRENLKAFVLHPHGLVSEIQRRMMTCVDAPNICNLAIEGNFDDCQKLVKQLFQDEDLAHLNLAAMNSINWARICAQTVYYFFAIAQLKEHAGVVFSVPSGNFGNIYSGWVAKQMGAPIRKLIAAVNTNDTLAHFLKSGELGISSTQPSLAPAMDVSVPSNLERLIFELLNRSGADTLDLYSSLNDEPPDNKQAPNIEGGEDFHALWEAYSIQDSSGELGGISGIIEKVRDECGIWIDPHTAVGVGALLLARQNDPSLDSHPQVVLATAHPSKFGELYEGKADPPELPADFADLKSRPEHYDVLPPDFEAVKAAIS